MKNIQYTNSPGIPHQSMDKEFLCHKKSPEWWYSTGYMHNQDNKLYTYQFTLAKIKIYSITFIILMVVLTDLETGKHYYQQESIFSEKKLTVDMAGENFSLDIDMDVVKPRVWHAEDSKLMMGIENDFTYYWS